MEEAGVLQGTEPMGLLEPGPAAFEDSPHPGPLAPVPSMATSMVPGCWFPRGIHYQVLQTGHAAG